MPCYFQSDSCKRENSFYTESHTRTFKITLHIYCDCCKFFTQSPENFGQVRDMSKMIRSEKRGKLQLGYLSQFSGPLRVTYNTHTSAFLDNNSMKLLLNAPLDLAVYGNSL